MRRALWTVGALALACAAAACARSAPAPGCQELTRAQRWDAAVATCRAAFTRHHDADDGVRLLAALGNLGRNGEIPAIAGALRGGPRDADAAYYLGTAALHARQLDRAGALLGEALAGHRARGALREAAHDAHLLSGVHLGRGRLRVAADLLAESFALATRADDRAMLGYVALARADLQRRLGDLRAAQRALDDAAAGVAGDPRGEAWVELKTGILHLEARRYAAADQALRALLARPAAEPRAIASARLQLAWLATELGRPEEADEHLREAARATGRPSESIAFGEAMVLAARGDVTAADARLGEIEAMDLTDTLTWVVPLERARLAAARGEPDRAAEALRRSIAAIERQRAAGVGDMPTYLDAHREPYYELFALHARAGRWDDALAELVALDAGDLFEAGAADVRWDSVSGPERAMPGPPPGPTELAAGAAALRASSRRAAIVLAIVAGDQLWRLELHAGQLAGAPVARAAEVDALVERLATDPSDHAAAAALGELIAVAPGAGPLHVALLGDLGRIPLALLRRHGELVIARRPLVRLVTLTPRRDAAVTGAPIVLGDPLGDLPGAAAEARAAAAHLATTAWSGADATATRLLAAAPRIVHIASHAGVDDRGSFLRLADRELHAREVAAASWGGSDLVVLASCGSAAARDAQGWGSLGSAFVRGGARAVLASSWSIADDQTRDLVDRFYRAGGAADPARALATVQLELAATTPARQWAAFAVLAAPPAPMPVR